MFRNKIIASPKYNAARGKSHFVRNTVRQRLGFIKWIQLILCAICSFCAATTLYLTPLLNLELILTLSINAIAIVIILTDIINFYFGRTFPSTTQLAIDVASVLACCACAVALFLTGNTLALIVALIFMQGLAAAMFLAEVVSKITLSSFLRKTARVVSVKDVAITAFVANPPLPRPKRSTSAAIPITYGGTFPVGKNLPPFLPEEIPDVGQTNKTKLIEAHVDQEKLKKSLWTCSSANAARKQPQTTPITYSGTFAVNKYTVPIANDLSPKSSPRTYTIFERGTKNKSQSNSPRHENESRNLKRTNYLVPVLPGSVGVEELTETDEKKMRFEDYSDVFTK